MDELCFGEETVIVLDERGRGKRVDQATASCCNDTEAKEDWVWKGVSGRSGSGW